MYEQSTQAAGRRRSTRGAVSGRRRTARSQENVRLLQLAVCVALFLAVFFGKGIFPQRLGQVREELLSLISTDFDFQAALSGLGASLAGGDTALSDLGAFCAEVFGAGEMGEDPAEPAAYQPPPPSGVSERERDFLSRNPSLAVRADHYTPISRFGLTVSLPAEEPEPAETPPAEPVTEPEAPPAVPALGTVVASPAYDGPELPENYTMDQLSLGEMETAVPVLGHLNSGFGYRDHPISGKNALHTGIDIGGQLGDPIIAFAAGTVEYTGESDACGLYLQLDHGNGVKSFYAHCSKIEVTKGQTVAMGEPIARIGSTGVSTGPHLHFELKYNNIRLNPAYYLEFLEQ